jgi:ADP-heptose:LPS heptosyltransferase
MESQRLSDVRRIVLVATHWLGDTFWALQTVPFLQRQHPHAVIHLLVRDSLRWLARAWLPEAQLFATRGLVSDRRRESLWRSLRLGEDLAQLRRHQPPIDLLIDYTNTRATALLTLALRPARSIGAGMASGSRLYSSWRDARSFERHLAERPWWILAPH